MWGDAQKGMLFVLSDKKKMFNADSVDIKSLYFECFRLCMWKDNDAAFFEGVIVSRL